MIKFSATIITLYYSEWILVLCEKCSNNNNKIAQQLWWFTTLFEAKETRCSFLCIGGKCNIKYIIYLCLQNTTYKQQTSTHSRRILWTVRRSLAAAAASGGDGERASETTVLMLLSAESRIRGAHCCHIARPSSGRKKTLPHYTTTPLTPNQ